jgi:hypothetical protein
MQSTRKGFDVAQSHGDAHHAGWDDKGYFKKGYDSDEAKEDDTDSACQFGTKVSHRHLSIIIIIGHVANKEWIGFSRHDVIVLGLSMTTRRAK